MRKKLKKKDKSRTNVFNNINKLLNQSCGTKLGQIGHPGDDNKKSAQWADFL